MQRLIQFIRSYYHVMLFLILQSISLALIFKYNPFQRKVLLATTTTIVGSVHEKRSSITDYFELTEQNQRLHELNNLRLTEAFNSFRSDSARLTINQDSSGKRLFEYLPCLVVENSIRKNKNYFTINLGTQNGIEEGMGVINSEGVIGKILRVGEHFSIVMSVLNPDFKIIPTIQEKTLFNETTWDGHSFDELTITRVPDTTGFNIGTSVYTSPYSISFPEKISIGEIKMVKKSKNSEFYELIIGLSANMKAIRQAHVIKHVFKKEIDQLKENL